MCFDPISIGTIASIGSAAVGAAGSLYSSSQQTGAYRQQQAVAERRADVERQQGAYEASRSRDSATRQLASMRGGYASAGFALSGSPLNVIADSAAEASLDEQAIRYGATMRADNATFEAGQAGRNARSARVGGVIGAISPLINAFSQNRQNNQNRTMIRNPYLMGSA